MTRKQAIEVLQTYDMSEDNEDKEFIEAIKMAIKALEQEPNCPFYEIDDDGHGLCKNHRYMDECEDAVQRTSNADKKHVENTLEDAISRQAVMNLAHHYEGKGLGDMIHAFDVERLPPVQPKSETVTEFADRCRECGKRYVKRQTGKWIYQGDRKKPMYAWFSCDSCGAYIGTPTKYCSECGADMRGAENEIYLDSYAGYTLSDMGNSIT